MKILLTGASGFMGAVVCRRLMAGGHGVTVATRRDMGTVPMGCRAAVIGDLGPECDWRAALADCDAVVHLAARAHVMADTAADPLALFRHVNRDGTLALATQAADQGVKRFVFVSSIKVNGEATPPGRPFRGDDPAAPVDPYGVSKAEAEAGLAEIAARTGLSVAVVRPPLVHGPAAKGNLAALMTVLRRGLPLPLGAIDNRRSLVGLDNLADALAFLVVHSATGPFLIRDGEDVSTPVLIRRLAGAMGLPARLWPVPVAVLRLGAAMTGRGGVFTRLTGSLCVDDTPLRALGWRPPFSLDDGLRAMAAGQALTASVAAG